MSIYSLVYSSSSTTGAVGEAFAQEIEAVLARARRNNSARGLTGALLATEGRFVQVLEGQRNDVEAVFDRISADPSHDNIEVLASQSSDRPRFKDWSMAFVGDSPALRRHFANAPLAALGRHQTGDAVLDFMLDVARCPADAA